MREAIKRGGLLVINGTEVENTTVRTDRIYDYDHVNAEGTVAEANVSVNVSTLYRGRGAAPAGYDGEAAFGIGTVDSVHFLVHGEATAGRGATGTVRQGFYIPAPAP